MLDSPELSQAIERHHEGRRMVKRADDEGSKYFGTKQSTNTIPEIEAEIGGIMFALRATNLQLLEGTPDAQRLITKQTVLALMVAYFTDFIAAHKRSYVEAQLRPSMERLSRMVAEDMKRRELEAAVRESAAAQEEKKEKGFTRGEGRKPGDRARKKRPAE